MAIWFSADLSLESLNAMRAGTMLEALNIEYTAIGDDSLEATMPVNHRTVQPAGLLHGGASVALAESLGSTASWLCLDPDRFQCVGLEINANHVRAKRKGMVTGIARPVHLGQSTHVWDCRVHDEKNRLVSIARLTMAILPNKR